MDRDTFPIPSLPERKPPSGHAVVNAKAFDTYGALESSEPSEHLYRKYLLLKRFEQGVSLERSRYLPPGNHQQRWWDQQHDY